MRRRRFLALVGTASALAGCAGAGSETERPDGDDGSGPTPTPAGTRSSTSTATAASAGDTASGVDANPTATERPVRAETPAAGECAATDPPEPDPDAVRGELARNETPRSYPAKPEMDPASVRSFVEDYERTYRYNAVLTGDVDGVPAGISRVDTWLRDSEVRSGAGGFFVEVFVTLNYGDDRDEPGTGTPAPTGHQPTSATYYVTDRFLLRSGDHPPLGATPGPPTIRGGAVVECW